MADAQAAMIDTRLTRMFGLTHAVVQAPMADIADGRLAAAVARAGGLGMIGGGKCDPDWIDAQFESAGNEAVGCAFWAWRLAEAPGLLARVLARRPRAICLSYGDPRPYSEVIAQARVPLICQVQSLEEARRAVQAGAFAIAAQGCEGGGYGARKPLIPLLMELADFLHEDSHDTLLVAGGGIVDARGLAACITMGADGVVMGTRLWASEEAMTDHGRLAAARTASANGKVSVESGNPAGSQEPSQPHGKEWSEEVFAVSPVLGEGIRLISDAPSIHDILEMITNRAANLMTNSRRKVIGLRPRPVIDTSIN